ncbi:MAG TPA: energy transducer TonB [Tangfeifania sp.]|nr:energy transducer TonB [Tangfeifania sp.]
MKTIFAVFICLASFAVSDGQNKMPLFEAKKYAMITQDQKCESLTDYLLNCLRYPEECMKSRDEGTEVLKFTVTSNGELRNFEVVNSVSPEIDDHLTGILKRTSGMWSPGMKNGIPVNMEKEIAVAFKCSELGVKALYKNFKNKANANLDKGIKLMLVKNKPEKALRYFNRGIRYCPYEDCLRLARGLCRYELGDKTGANEDFERMTIAGISTDSRVLAEQMCDLKGYEKLAQILSEREFPR